MSTKNFLCIIGILLSNNYHAQDASEYFEDLVEILNNYKTYSVNYISYENEVFLDKGSVQKSGKSNIAVLRTDGFAIQEDDLQLNVFETEMTVILKKASIEESNPLTTIANASKSLNISFVNNSELSDNITLKLEHKEMLSYVNLIIDAKKRTITEISIHSTINGQSHVLSTKYSDWQFNEDIDNSKFRILGKYVNKVNNDYMTTELLKEYDFINLTNY
jgi:outer membrane lipoprotein-sorting protein